ncbi:MAG: hypothetical protein ACYDCX_06095 [Acidithiobacillus sp.]
MGRVRIPTLLLDGIDAEAKREEIRRTFHQTSLLYEQLFDHPAYTTNPTSAWGGFMTTLGLSPQSVTTAWGEPMGIGNGPNANSGANTCNGNNRDPSSGNGNLNSPPYTAFIDAWAPGGVLLSVPVIGTY